MGDAGPPSPVPVLREETELLSETVGADQAPPLREVKVLVTGFGPFKSFLINPSWLIASALPDELYPSTSTVSSLSDVKSAAQPYKIRLLVHPSAVRVSYSNVSTTVPDLIATHNPDYVFHMGMAAGRDCYTLETRAHRDNYRIKDVDDSDGFVPGEQRWKREGVPEVIYVGWDEADVLERWDAGVKKGLAEKGFLGRSEMERAIQLQRQQHPAQSHGPLNLLWGTGNVPMSTTKADEHRKKAVVKLSADAGRFLCEYIIFESLSRRWLDARNTHDEGKSVTSTSSATPSSAAAAIQTLLDLPTPAETALERLGKVAFLHVPGWTGVDDINRGVMVAEEAIRALVGSWEDGYRRNGRVEAKAYTKQHSEEKGRVAAS